MTVAVIGAPIFSPNPSTPVSFFAGISSDVDTGTMHWYSNAVDGAPSEADMISGAGSLGFSSFARNASNPQGFSAGGVPDGTTQYIYIMQVDAGDNSNVFRLGQLDTPAFTNLSNLLCSGLTTLSISFDSDLAFGVGGIIQDAVVDIPANIVGIQDFQVQNGTNNVNAPALVAFENEPVTAGLTPTASVGVLGLTNGVTYQLAVLVQDDRGFGSEPRPLISATFVASDGGGGIVINPFAGPFGGPFKGSVK